MSVLIWYLLVYSKWEIKAQFLVAAMTFLENRKNATVPQTGL